MWILLLIMVHHTGVTSLKVEFNTEQACETARRELRAKTIDDEFWDVTPGYRKGSYKKAYSQCSFKG